LSRTVFTMDGGRDPYEGWQSCSIKELSAANGVTPSSTDENRHGAREENYQGNKMGIQTTQKSWGLDCSGTIHYQMWSGKPILKLELGYCAGDDRLATTASQENCGWSTPRLKRGAHLGEKGLA